MKNKIAWKFKNFRDWKIFTCSFIGVSAASLIIFIAATHEVKA